MNVIDAHLLLMSLLMGKVQATIYENILSQGYVYLKDICKLYNIHMLIY